MRIGRLAFLGAAGLASIAFTCLNVPAAFAQTEPQKPNVIIIFTDDMGYSDISSFANNPLPARTTNIDQMAEEGMKFTHFYVAMPICSPSRAAMLSGRFAPEAGLTNFLQQREGNQQSDQEDYMDPSHSHLPRSFQAAGYHTAHVGKWHLGGGRDVDNAPAIREYGYNEAYSTWESPNPDPQLGIRYAPWDTRLEAGQVPRYRRTEYMVNKTLDILARNPDKPCFVTLWPDDLHTPFWPSPEMAAKWGGVVDDANTRKDLYGVLEEYDRQIGRLIQGIKDRGIDENTIVIFTGDNGPAPDFGRERTNGMNGNKLSLYEGGVRQPFIIWWPGHVPAGTTNDRTVMSTIDFLPTLTSLVGIPMVPEGAAVADGEDLSAAFFGGNTLTRTKPLMWEYGRTSKVPRPGVNDEDRSPILAIRDGDFKLLFNPDNTGHELYNVRTDPREDNNLAPAYPAVVQSLSQKVLAWRETLPHRTQPYPPFNTVSFGQVVIREYASASALQSAAGRNSTARVDGVAAAPNGEDDVFAIHADAEERKTFLAIDADGSIEPITNSEQLKLELNAFEDETIDFVGGLDYSGPGDRLFVVEVGTRGTSEPWMLDIGASGLSGPVVKKGGELVGMTDHAVIPNGSIVGVRGAAGNRSVGSIAQATGAWTQNYSQAQLMAAAPGTTQIIPETIAANSSTGEIHISSHQDPRQFRITSITGGSGALSMLTQPQLANCDFHDLVADQQGNIYGYDEPGQKIMVVRRSDGRVYQVPLSIISQVLGRPTPFVPVRWRGLAARMADDTHADLFLASSTPEYGVVQIRFGTIPASVGEWSLY